MKRNNEPFVLAISPSPRGFAFVLFQGTDRPFDWGVKEVRGQEKNVRCMQTIRRLFDQYRPVTLVVEDTTSRTRRGFRTRTLLRSIEKCAATRTVVVVRCSRKQVRAVFAEENARTRPAIAEAIAR